MKKELEKQVKENEGLKKYQDEMQKKYEILEKKAAEGPQIGASGGSHEETLGNFRKTRAANQ